MKTETKDKLFLILSMVIFGTIGIFRKYIPLPSGTVATFRGFICVLFLTIVFLIKKKKPDFSVIEGIVGYTKSEILQIYITSEDGCDSRVRRRVYPDKTVYTKTEKRHISKMSAIERECKITEAEFSKLSLSIECGTRPIRKTRHTFPYLGKTVEIDEYPFWESTCILEVELKDEGEELILPDFIFVLSEKTGDKAYSNHSMARSVPSGDYL